MQAGFPRKRSCDVAVAHTKELIDEIIRESTLIIVRRFVLDFLEFEHDIIEHLQNMPIGHKLQQGVRLLLYALGYCVLHGEWSMFAAEAAHVRCHLVLPLGPQLDCLVGTIEEQLFQIHICGQAFVLVGVFCGYHTVSEGLARRVLLRLRVPLEQQLLSVELVYSLQILQLYV